MLGEIYPGHAANWSRMVKVLRNVRRGQGMAVKAWSHAPCVSGLPFRDTLPYTPKHERIQSFYLFSFTNQSFAQRASILALTESAVKLSMTVSFCAYGEWDSGDLFEAMTLRRRRSQPQVSAACAVTNRHMRVTVQAGGQRGAVTSGCNCGRISARARTTSFGKSISIHGEPVTSAVSNTWLRSSSRSRTASSCGRFERPLSM
jgi:hypothetical protein